MSPAPGNPPPSEPRPTRRRRGLVGWLRLGMGIALLLMLLMVNGVLALWLLRGEVLEGPLRRQLQNALREATGAEQVQVGAVRGNWIDRLRIEGVSLRGAPDTLLPRVADLSLTVQLDFSALWAWVAGDPAALPGVAEQLRVEAAALELRPDGRLPAGTTEPTEPDDDEAGVRLPEGLHNLLAGGVDLRIQELTVHGPEGPWRGTLSVRVEPRSPAARLAGDRQLTVRMAPADAGGPELWLSVHGKQLDTPRRAVAGLQLFGQDLAGWARLAGSPLPELQLPATEADGGSPRPVTGGATWLQASLWREGDRRRAWLWGTLEELAAGDLQLQPSYGAFRAELKDDSTGADGWHGRVQADRLVVALPGIELRLRDCGVPVDAASIADPTVLLVRAGGGAGISVRDLEPYRNLLPVDALQLLPVEGELRAALRDGTLLVQPSELGFQGGAIRIPRGRLPILPAAARPEGSRPELEFSLEVPEPLGLAIQGLPDRLVFAGSLSGSVAGSFGLPEAVVAIDLQGVEFGEDRIGGIRTQLDYREGVAILDDLAITGWRTPASDAALQLAGSGRLALPGGTSDTGSFSAQLTGEMAPDWLARFGLQPEDWPTDRKRPAQLEIEADGTLDGAWQPTRFQAQLSLADLRVADLPTAEAQLKAQLLDGRVRLEQCTVTGPLELRASGDVPLDPAGPLRMDVELDAPSLSRWSGLAMDPPLAGSARLVAEVRGTISAPEALLRVNGELTDGIAGLGIPWPAEAGPLPAGGIRIALEADAVGGGIAFRTLETVVGDGPAQVSVQGTGTLPMRFRDGSLEATEPEDPLRLRFTARLPGPPADTDAGQQGLPLDLEGELVTVAEEIRLENLRLAAGAGTLTGNGRIAAGPAGLANGPGDPEISADLQLAAFDLGGVPAAAVGLGDLAGQVDGTVQVGGTLGAPDPRLDLNMTGLTVAVPGGIRISEGDGSLQARPDSADLELGPAMMGGGSINLTAKVRTKGEPIWLDPGAMELEIRVTGTEALLVNASNVRARGDLDVRLAGTLDRMDATGQVVLTASRFAQRISLLLDLQSAGGMATETGIVPFRVPGKLGEALHFDVDVDTRRDLQVRTGKFDADLALDLKLGGTGALPFLQGTVNATSGSLSLPGMGMTLNSLLVNFPPEDPLHPRVALNASGRRSGIDVQLTANGRFDQLEPQLSSVPPYPAKALYTLVSTGSLPDALRNASDRDRGLLVASFLAQELAGWYFGGDSTDEAESFIDRINVEIGTEISRNGQENIIIEYRMVERWFLQAEQDVYEDFNGGVVYRLRF